MMQVPVPQHLVSSVITIPFLYLCVAPILAGRTGSAAHEAETYCDSLSLYKSHENCKMHPAKVKAQSRRTT
jgi:hypothetical protein